MVYERAPGTVLLGQTGLDSPAQRVAAVPEILMPGERARHVDDVVAVLRAEQAQIPVEHALPALAAKMPAQARLIGVGDHLLERRVADQRIVEQAGPAR